MGASGSGRPIILIPRRQPCRNEEDMDLSTIIGYVLAWGALLYGAHHASHGALGAYFKPGEILLVGGCALGAALASMPLHSVISALKSAKKLLVSQTTHI